MILVCNARFFKRIIAIIISITLFCLSMPVSFSVVATENQYSTTQIITDDEYYPDNYIGYRYPIRPGTSEWANLSNHQEMVDACEIPNEVLYNMTTEELAQTILAYPLLSDLFAYDDWDYGLEVITSHFNGLTNFKNRSDCASALVSAYANQPAIRSDSLDEATALAFETGDLSATMNADYGVCRDIFFNISLSVLLTNEDYASKLSPADQEALSTVAIQKAILDDNGLIYAPESFSLLSSDTVTTKATTVTFVSLLDFENYISEILTVTTPKMSAITAYGMKFREYWLGSDNMLYVVNYDDLPASYITVFNNENYNKYRIYPIGNPTVSYNCHSYAWYQQSTTNPVWIDDPSRYLTDGSYTQVSELNAVVGDRVVYYESSNDTYTGITHSAVITSCSQISSSSKLFTLTSKWGMSGLYVHSLTNCPYYYVDDDNPSNLYVYDYNFYH